MSGKYRIIDESNFNELGVFDSVESAVDYVATLLTVNDEEYLEDLTIGAAEGPILYGEALRRALQDRGSVRQRPKVTAASGSYGAEDSGHKFTAIPAKSHE